MKTVPEQDQQLMLESFGNQSTALVQAMTQAQVHAYNLGINRGQLEGQLAEREACIIVCERECLVAPITACDKAYDSAIEHVVDAIRARSKASPPLEGTPC